MLKRDFILIFPGRSALAIRLWLRLHCAPFSVSGGLGQLGWFKKLPSLLETFYLPHCLVYLASYPLMMVYHLSSLSCTTMRKLQRAILKHATFLQAMAKVKCLEGPVLKSGSCHQAEPSGSPRYDRSVDVSSKCPASWSTKLRLTGQSYLDPNPHYDHSFPTKMRQTATMPLDLQSTTPPSLYTPYPNASHI